jgi:SET domain
MSRLVGDRAPGSSPKCVEAAKFLQPKGTLRETHALGRARFDSTRLALAVALGVVYRRSVAKRDARRAMFSLSPVLFKNSPIEGRGVFARRHFAPGDVIAPYAPKQERVPFDDPRAIAGAATKLTLSSDDYSVIIPDTSVPGGWLCNHSCSPNAALYSSGEGRIRCLRPIAPGQEVTIFYGWVTVGEPTRDPCRCGSKGCLGTINFDLDEREAFALGTDAGAGLRARLADYEVYLRSIDQVQVMDAIHDALHRIAHKGQVQE